MINRLDLTVRDVQRDLDELRRDYPEIDEDDELRAGMLEGSTGLHDLLSTLVAQARQARANSAAVKAMIEAYVAPLRKQVERHERRAELRKALIMRLMDRAGEHKVALPEAPLSIARVAPKAVPIDPDAIPDEFCRIERKPMLVEIGKALRDGHDVPGTILSNPGRTLKGL